MIRIKLPVIVDASALRVMVKTAVRCNSQLRIETFFRVVEDGMPDLDCDTAEEVAAYAELLRVERAEKPAAPAATFKEAFARKDEAPRTGDAVARGSADEHEPTPRA